MVYGKKLKITEGKPPLTLKQRIWNAWFRLQREWRILMINRQVKSHANPDENQRPIALFNASTRLGGFSQNAAFSLVTAWGLQLANIRVIHFVCRSGMSRCVLGTNLDNPYEKPPCTECVAQSKKLLRSGEKKWFGLQHNPELSAAVKSLSVEALSKFQLTIDNPRLSIHGRTVPIGQLVMPGLRWALRRHHLVDDEPTRFLLRAYIQSAYNVIEQFEQFLEAINPRAVVIFNGIMYPEAAARWAAQQRNIRVITHEVGFQPFSAFFTNGQATAYPMEISEDFELSKAQNARLDEYLSQRFKGEFTMAGIRFWPEISGLDAGFLQKASEFEQIVPIFTNVVNDTSQVHASKVFADMYDWLNHTLEIIEGHSKTLFVIRAHPDEKRRGTRKHSRQPVSDWIIERGVDQLPNVVFIDSNEALSSYELIKKSKFVMVYNSSIGLEAVLLGIPVLCGGKARYTQYPTVAFPQTPVEHQELAARFLSQEAVELSDEFIQNARRVIYWQLYRVSLPFDRYIAAHPTPGYVQLRKFRWQDLLEKESPTIKVLKDGIIDGAPFIMPDGA